MIPKIVDNKPTLGGNIRFTGMAIYWTMWAEAGIKRAESDEAVAEDDGRNSNAVASAPAPATDANTTSLKKQYDKRYIIFGEQTWPAKEDVSPLEGGL